MTASKESNNTLTSSAVVSKRNSAKKNTRSTTSGATDAMTSPSATDNADLSNTAGMTVEANGMGPNGFSDKDLMFQRSGSIHGESNGSASTNQVTSSVVCAVTSDTKGQGTSDPAAIPPDKTLGFVPGNGRFRMTAKNATIRINRSPKQADGSGGNTTIHIEGKHGQGQVHIQHLPDNVESTTTNTDPTNVSSTPFVFKSSSETKLIGSRNNFTLEQNESQNSVGSGETPFRKGSTKEKTDFLSSVIDGKPVLFHPGAAERGANTGGEKSKSSGVLKSKSGSGSSVKDRSGSGGVGNSSYQRGALSKRKVGNPQKQLKEENASARSSYSSMSNATSSNNQNRGASTNGGTQNAAVSAPFPNLYNSNVPIVPSATVPSEVSQDDHEETLLEAAKLQHQQLLQIQQKQQQALQIMMLQLMMQNQEQGSLLSSMQAGTDTVGWQQSNPVDWTAALASAAGMPNFDANMLGPDASTSLETLLNKKVEDNIGDTTPSNLIVSKANDYLMNAATAMGVGGNAPGGGCTGKSNEMSGSIPSPQPPLLPYNGLSGSSSATNNGGDVNLSINMLLNWLHSSHDQPAVQTEALWALTNVAGLAPPNLCAGLSGSTTGSSAGSSNAGFTSGNSAFDSSGSVDGSLTPQLQALLQQQQAQLQHYQQSLAAMSAASTSLSSSGTTSSLTTESIPKVSQDSSYRQGNNNSYTMPSDGGLSGLLSQSNNNEMDQDGCYGHGDGDNLNKGPLINNLALSNFLEHAALSGVHLDPSTLAAAVQLCTSSNSDSTNNALFGDPSSSNKFPQLPSMKNWATGGTDTKLLAGEGASAVMTDNSTAGISFPNSDSFADTVASGKIPSQLSSSMVAAINASGGSSAPSFSNDGADTSNSSLIQTLSTAASLTNNFGAGTSGSQLKNEAGSGNSSFSNSPSSNVLLSHADAIPTLISLLRSPHRQVHEQAMWILGSIVVGTTHSNMNAIYGAANGSGNSNDSNSNTPPSNSSSSSSQAAASAVAREAVLGAGILEPLCQCLNENAWNISLQRIGSWLLSNLVIPSTNNNNSNGNNNDGDKDGSDDSSNNGDVSIMDDVGPSNGGAMNSKGGKKDRNKSDVGNDGGYSGGGTSSVLNVDAIMPTLHRLIFSGDADVLSHTCWALSHLCDGPSSHIAAVVCDSHDEQKTSDMGNGVGAASIPQRLVELLLHPSWRVTKPALRTIGNIVCAECTDGSKDAMGNSGDGTLSHSQLPKMCPAGLQDYTEIVLQCGAVPHLKTLISHCNKEIQKEACWTLSNIAAGTISQIQAVMDCGAIPPLVRLASDVDTDHEVRSEACWVVLNATSCGSDDQVQQLVADGCVHVLGVLLKEASMVMMALEGLERVLQVEEAREKDLSFYEDYKKNSDKGKKADDPNISSVGSVVNANLIESLEHHKNSAVAKRAQRIWKVHFVRCALCQQYYSRHRKSEAKFCNECKCHVCSTCNCEVYHLSYQEELWAATEEKDQAEKTSKSKKNKNKKKKEKKKQQQSKAKDSLPVPAKTEVVSISAESSLRASDAKNNKKGGKTNGETNFSRKGASNADDDSVNHTSSVSSATENGSINSKPAKNDKSEPASKPAISSKKVATTAKLDQLVPSGIDANSIVDDDGDSVDFVLYLQQTGSIIALSKLMDALDYDKEEDEEVDLRHLISNNKEITL